MCSLGAEVEPIEALFSAIARFCARPRDAQRTPADTAEELIRLRRACDRLELEFARMASAFAVTDEFDVQGAVSPIAWLKDRCNMTGHDAASAVCVGRKAASLPRSTEAMADGRIGFAHLTMLARTAEAVETTEALFDEQSLLRRAEAHDPNRFRRDCAHARHAADAAAFLAEQRRSMEARFLELRPVGDEGCLWIRGFLDAAGGATVLAALEPLARPSGAGDLRLRPRRFADALVELAAHALDTGMGAAGRRRQLPHLQVTTTLETLLGVPGAPAGEVAGAAVVATATVERLSCASTVRRILLGPDSSVVDVGRARRLPSAGTRRAVEQRDRGCVWPGCDRPVGWTAIHHIVHWGRGGATEKGNLCLLCHRHHTKVHEGGWQILRLGESGEIVVVPPRPGADDPLIRGPDMPTAA